MTTRSISKAPPAVDVHGAFLRRTDLSGASLRNANLSQADFSNAVFRNADFLDAQMVGTILRGADLTSARNLTLEQIAGAIIDEHTRLPANIDMSQLRSAQETRHEAMRN